MQLASLFKRSGSEPARSRVPFRLRFKAWWEGYDLPPSSPDEDDEAGVEPEDEPPHREDRDEEEEEDESPSSGHGLRQRLKAWWEGYDLSPADEDEEAEERPPAPPPPAASRGGAGAAAGGPRAGVWPKARIRIAERVWGPGFVTPGGADYIRDLLRPCALNPKMSVLCLTAATGGPARAIAEAFGLTLAAMESSRELAGHAPEAGVRIEVFDPEAPELRKGQYDCVFAKELFFTVDGKEALFRDIAAALAGEGQLLFTDYLLPEGKGATPAVDEWAAREPVPPKLWPVEKVRAALEAAGLEVRAAEDMTEAMHGLIVSGWNDLLAGLHPGDLEREEAEALIAEAEYWARRLTVLDSGDLRLFRVHAAKA